MKKRIIALIAITLLPVCNFVTATVVETAVSSIQQVQMVNAIYHSTNGLGNILIRIHGGCVTSICMGTDWQGRQVWKDIQASKITKNSRNFRDSTNPFVCNAINSKEYTAYLNLGYGNSLRIYF